MCYCVFVPLHCSQTYDCRWIGPPYDCYVMSSRNENSPFLKIGLGNGPGIGVDSDEERVNMHGEEERLIKYDFLLLDVSFHLCTSQ